MSLVQPGDLVSFIVSAGWPGSPTLADDPPKAAAAGKPDPKGGPGVIAARPQPRDGVEKCGPFKVLSIGNRLGSYDVMMAAKIPQSQENVMTILVRYYEGDKMDPEAAKLIRILQQTGAQPLAYELHSRTEKKE
jgi:hypothetical protein